jgi:hypothetical protein
MMDEHDGGAEAALELAEESKQGSDFTACVLIDAVEAHKGIEDEEAWFQGGDGVDESEAVVRRRRRRVLCRYRRSLLLVDRSLHGLPSLLTEIDPGLLSEVDPGQDHGPRIRI